MVHGFVVVAVEQNQITASQHGIRDNFVGRAGAVQDEVRLVGAEYVRGMALGLGGRPFVDKQVSETDIGVAEVVAENALAEVFEEELTGGRFAIELSALMARAVERDVGLNVVGHQSAEEWRQKLHSVVNEAGNDLFGVKGRCLLAQVDVARDLAEKIEAADIGDPVCVRESPQGRAKADTTDRAHEGTGTFESVAINHCDIRPDSGVLGDVSVEGFADLDLEVFRADPVKKLPDLGIFGIHDRYHFEQFVEGNGNSRCFLCWSFLPHAVCSRRRKDVPVGLHAIGQRSVVFLS